MPQFEYFALDVNGKQRKGKLVADTQEQAAAELKRQGLFPTQLIDPEAKKRLARRRAKRNGGLGNVTIGAPVIKRKDLTIFTRQLATLLEAGLPLIRSLRTLERQAKNPAIKRIIGETADTVEGGSTFAEALSRNPRTFDKLYLNMVRAGEASGAMELILSRLAGFMEKAAQITHKVKSAMIYPAVVLTIALTVSAGLMIFIVPNFEKMFTEMLEGEPLPQVTLFIIGISRVLKSQIHLVAIGIAVIIVLYKLANRTKYGKYGIDWVKYNMPLFGPIISRSSISRFSRTLGTLMASGVPVLNSLIIVRDTAGNDVVSSAVQKVHDAVKEGEGVAAPLGATGIFPQMVISMVEVGEETGRLPEMLDKIANTYDEEVDNAVGALTSLIEPLMIVTLAVIVGTIVVAMFMPMVTMIEKMGN
ncbi:MAG: type II secretion system F family protein [Lentisphaeria bacterium]|nr:type II secretion system F family protein [Lentisphaeria bacterium]